MSTAYGIAIIAALLLVLFAPAIYRRHHNSKYAFGQTRIVKMDDGTYRIQVWAYDGYVDWDTQICHWMESRYICITSIKELEDVHILNRFDTLEEAIEARKKYDVWVKEYYDLTHEIKVVA